MSETETTKEIQVQAKTSVPANFNEITDMASAFVKSGMFADVKAVAQAIVKIMAGAELGLPPVYSMQNINMIRNRLTSSANTLAMLVKRSGKYNYAIIEHTDDVCTIEFCEIIKGAYAAIGKSTFSMVDARRANLIKPDSGWEHFPRAMLFSRAISQGARIYCPDAIGGVYTDEEIRSIPERYAPGDTPAPAPAAENQSDDPAAGMIEDRVELAKLIRELQCREPAVWRDDKIIANLNTKTGQHNDTLRSAIDALTEVQYRDIYGITKAYLIGLDKAGKVTKE